MKLLLLAMAAISCAPPENEITIGETLLQLGDELNALRQENAIIQSQLDSLRSVMAKQDTVLRQLANISGMPVR